jgi:putative oxidoreductase
MGLPAPGLMAFLTTAAEVLGVFFLIAGFGVRFISIPLIITMVVAIITVHGPNGFNVCDGGYKFPVYYILMLTVLLVYGSGRAGLDYWLFRKVK